MSKMVWISSLVCLLLLGTSVTALGQGMPGPEGLQGRQAPLQSRQGPPFNRSNPQEGLKAILGVLVIDGVIEREQAIKILEYFKKEMPAMQSPFPVEQQEPFQNKMKQQQNLFAPLIKDGIINQEQAWAVKEALFKMGLPHPPGMPGSFESPGTPPCDNK